MALMVLVSWLMACGVLLIAVGAAQREAPRIATILSCMWIFIYGGGAMLLGYMLGIVQ